MEVLLDQPELSQVPNKSQRLLQAKFDFFIMQLFTYLLCFKKVLNELHIFERKYIAKNFILKKYVYRTLLIFVDWGPVRL